MSTSCEPQREPLHLLHLFYKVEHGQWQLLGRDEQREWKTHLTGLVQQIRATERTELLTLGVVSPKADLGFLLITPDLDKANTFEKQLSLSLGPDVLSPVLSQVSLLPTGADLDLPSWPVVCYSPANRRREPAKNWCTLPAAERDELESRDAAILEEWKERASRVASSSVGLDDADQAITWFSLSSAELNAFASALRFRGSDGEYTQFGEHYLGIQLPLADLFRRLLL